MTVLVGATAVGEAGSHPPYGLLPVPVPWHSAGGHCVQRRRDCDSGGAAQRGMRPCIVAARAHCSRPLHPPPPPGTAADVLVLQACSRGRTHLSLPAPYSVLAPSDLRDGCHLSAPPPPRVPFPLYLTAWFQLEAVGSPDLTKRLLLLVTPKYVDILFQRNLQRLDRIHLLLGPLVAAKLTCGSYRGKPERLVCVDEGGEVQTMLLKVRVRVQLGVGVGVGWQAAWAFPGLGLCSFAAGFAHLLSASPPPSPAPVPCPPPHSAAHIAGAVQLAQERAVPPL